MTSHAFVDEIIIDLLSIDPDLKNIKSELEKLIQELIANKPQTPFTKEFKDSLKAQIIGAINDQKILYEEKKWNRNEMLHSLKFWMVGVSTVTAGLLMFTLFHYIEDFQQPTTQIVYKEPMINNKTFSEESLQEQPTARTISMSDEVPTEGFGGGAANRADNVMMLAMPESNLVPETKSLPTNKELTDEEPIMEYAMMKMSAIENENTTKENVMARSGIATDEATATSATSPNFCETSQQFLLANNISGNVSKTFTYENQIYKATINFINNSITIDHIGTQDDSKIQTEIPNLNIFFEKNNINIKSDYSSPIIEETDTYFEYYYPRKDNQEWITVRIDKTNNIIFSIQNICVY